jgi:hypothetical protein
LPGVYCGKPKTTLVTETRETHLSSTNKPMAPEHDEKPKSTPSSGQCPYPGRQC